MSKALGTSVLAMAMLVTAPAGASESTLKPLDASMASLISGEPARAQSAPVTTYQAPAVYQAPVPMNQGSVLQAGSRLSSSLEQFVRTHGWQLRWNIDEDYLLDVGIPLPAGDVIQGVTYVINTYQSQGGMLGVVPRFAKSNRVVVIEKMDVRDN